MQVEFGAPPSTTVEAGPAVRVVIFGVTGMVGRGVLKECLDDDGVEDVLVVGRRECGERHKKLREVLHDDFFDYSALRTEFADRDTCFFCLGVSSIGQDKVHIPGQHMI